MSGYSLWPHQERVAPLLKSGSTILWWEMRTGKSRTALHAFNQLYNEGKVMDLVVVTVAMAKATWRQEVEEMNLGIPVLVGFGKKRAEIRSTMPTPNWIPRIFILNWEILPEWQRLLKSETRDRQRPFVLVLDESHLNLRNPNNKRYKAAHWLAQFSYATWILTGTLLVKSGLDVYYQSRLLGRKSNPFSWMDPKDFGERYCQRRWNPFDKMGRGDWEYLNLKDPDEVVAKMSAMSVLRIRDVADVPLPTQIPRWIEDLNQQWDFRRNDAELDEEIAALIPIKAKLTADYVAQLPARPVVVFGWHTAFTEQVAERLEAPLIRGDTSQADREAIHIAFQAGKIPVLVGNLRSLGLGISLSKANTFVYGEPYWDASLYLQAMARGTTLDKTEPIVHHHLLVAGSVDEYVWRRRLERGRAIEQLFQAAQSRDLPDATDKIRRG